MKKLIRSFLGVIPILAMAMALGQAKAEAETKAKAKPANACSYANANQRCATVPLADAARDAAAKKFRPEAAGKAGIYIVRASAGVKRKTSAISVDGRPVADLAPFTYALLQLAPGRHKIRAAADKTAEINLNVEPGKLYFVQTELSLLFLTVSSRFKLLDQAQGRSLVSQAMLVAPLGH